LLKADLHIHTEYSFDCGTSLEQIVSRCIEVGINCIAIADHGTVEGALKMQQFASFKVVVAEEILTPLGEIMGMFLQETIPSGITAEEAVTRIRSQGGLVCLPHPYDRFRPGFLRHASSRAVLDQVDIVECFNARSLLGSDGNKARAFAEEHGLPCSAGSDAHTLGEIGSAYVEMPEFNSRDEFCSALAQGRVFGHKAVPWVHLPSTWASLKKKLFR